MNPCTPHPNKASQTGLSLIELMVAITLGLVIMAGLSTLFVANSSTSAEIERANRQIENGRYAMQILSEDLRLAGFLGEFDPTALATPATKPDPCSAVLADLKTALPLHIQGYNNVASATPLASSCPSLTDVKTGTDILVIRRASTCFAGAADCEAVSAGMPYFQASLCKSATQLGSNSISDYYALDTNSANLTRQNKDCLTTNLAGLRRYRTHIYFIANNDKGSDGIPTLKRVELGASGGVASFLPPVALVEGIENLQIEYGIDTAGNGGAGLYTTDPDSSPACSGAACVTNWRNVVAVKLNLLARNTTASPGYTDTKIYSLGSTTTAASNDGFKRHVYQTAVRLNNPSGRKQP
jgi:type IV pilus assembly protein PilW